MIFRNIFILSGLPECSPAVLILNLIISFVPVERKREIGYNILKNFESVADYGRENECNAHAVAEKDSVYPA